MDQPEVPKSKVFSIRIQTDLFNTIEQVAAEEHRNRQSIIVAAIELYLERRRVAIEGAAQYVAEFDQAKTQEMIVDRALQAAAATQTQPAPGGLEDAFEDPLPAAADIPEEE